MRKSMVMRSQAGSEPAAGGELKFCQYEVLPLTSTGRPPKPRMGDCPTAFTESTNNQNTSLFPGKLNRNRSPGATSPAAESESPTVVELATKLVTSTAWDSSERPATSVSDQRPADRAGAIACVSPPESSRNSPGNGNWPVSAIFVSATRITQQRRPPFRKNARTADGRYAYTGCFESAAVARIKSSPKISWKCAMSSTITGRLTGPLAAKPTNTAMSMRTSASSTGGATTSN